MKLRHYFSVIAIAVLAASCTKQGPAGPQGPAGANGSANVTISDYVLTSVDWMQNGPEWYTNLTPTIDPTTASVSLLFSYDDIHWFGLPYVGYSAGDVDINYVVSTNNIQIQYTPQTNGNPVANPSNGGNTYVQVTLIPPSIQAKYPNMNWQNAMAVSKLPEVEAAAAHVQK